MERDELLKSLDGNSKCPKCGVSNKCAVKLGKSISACWCAGLPPLGGEVIENACLCRKCLVEACAKQKRSLVLTDGTVN